MWDNWDRSVLLHWCEEHFLHFTPKCDVSIYHLRDSEYIRRNTSTTHNQQMTVTTVRTLNAPKFIRGARIKNTLIKR